VQVEAGAAQTAPPAADEAAQEIGVHAVVAPGHPAIVGQPLLRAVELRLPDDGRHRRRDDPLGLVQGLLHPCGALADGEQGGAAPLGGMPADAVGADLADIGGVGQHAT
jgi:hypothetical protein